MKLVNHPLLFITPLFIIGIVLGFQYWISLNKTAIVLCICFFIFTTSYCYGKTKLLPQFSHTIITGLTIVTVGFATTQFQRIENRNHHYIHQNLEEDVFIEGEILEKLKPNRYYNNYVLELKTLQQKSVEGEVLFSIQRDTSKQELAVGDHLLLKEKLTDVFAPLNPYQFNYQDYLKKRKIFKQARSNSKGIKVLKVEEFSFQQFAERARKQIIEQLNKSGLSKDQIDLTSALLLGQKKELSKDIYNDFTNAGVVHILAVSGLHVGIILIFLNLIFRPLRKFKFGKWAAYICSLICIWAFALLVGFSPSVIRAALMFSFLNAGLIFNKKASTFNMLCLSAILMLLWDAYLIFSVGFQMSYLAVLGIISFQPLIKRRFYIKNRGGRYFFDILTVSFCAQLGVTPLIFLYFHKFPSLFLVTNLLIIPWLMLLFFIGILVIIFALLQIEFSLLYEFYGSLLDALLWIIHLVANRESFLFQNIFFTSKMMLAFYGVILFVFAFVKYFQKALLYFILISILSFQLIYAFEYYQVHKQNKFYILHQSRTTVLAEKSGYQLNVYAKNTTKIQKLKFLENFKTELAIKDMKKLPQKNFYGINETKNLLVIDSLGVYKIPKNVKADYILLTNSPKINLDRVLESLKPQQIIVDGSNYFSYVKRWKETCIKKKVPFHFTGKKGAFIIDY
ncbi:ComEC/Rec2 family competence protein [Aquimarina celericrescens]|nr:ComEC/Rec2 family competence protein [Aquimarina celericrescens]